MPVANGGFIAGIHAGHLWVIGGTTWADDEKHWLHAVESYSLADAQWRAAGTTPAPVAYAAFAANRHGLHWLGGSDGAGVDDGLYRLTADASIRRVAATGHRVIYAGFAADEHALYVVGGSTDVADFTTLSARFLRVDLDTGGVTTLPDFPGGPVMLSAVARLGDDLLVFGGARYDAADQRVVNVTDAYAYSLKHNAWRTLAPLPWARRGVAACSLDAGAVLLAGGYGDVPGESGEAFARNAVTYNPAQNRYAPAAELPYAAMGQALLVHQHRLYVLGGEDRPRHRVSRFFRRHASN